MRVNRVALPLLWMMLSVLLSACSSTMTQPAASLYDRLGGKTAIAAVVDDFVGNVAADKRINGYFSHANISRLQQMLVEQICAGTGGPWPYNRRGIGKTHGGMGLGGG